MVVRPTRAFGLDELADHHLCGLETGDLGIDLRELLAQSLGAIGRHDASLYHPCQHLGTSRIPPARQLTMFCGQ
ncbi:hypothetical protein ACFCYB_14430 [Streptomyces sp. NPDC056309]|uniref:hypothetical protein n=1 Tax=unclassified Streptomyces TaxID=2593676 RepID=UPI0035DFD60D